MDVAIVTATLDPVAVIAYATGKCYDVQKSENLDDYVRARVREGHTSVLEHAVITFEFSGISRACSHQIVRHRINSYTQESQRYVNMSETPFVMPESVSSSAEASEIYNKAMETARSMYSKLLAAGIKKEDARFVLPNATPTKLVVTMNYSAIRDFVTKRSTKHAQWEIREVARRVLHLANDICPPVFGDLMEEYG